MTRQSVVMVLAFMSVPIALADLRSAAPSILDDQRETLLHARDMQLARHAARDICESLIHDSRSANAPTALIADLTQALEIEDAGVRYFAVRSLALIGPRAASALPSLRELMDAESHPPPGTVLWGVSPIPRLKNAIDIIEGRTESLRPAVSDECSIPGVID